MKLQVTLGDVYAYLEEEIKVVEKMINAETDKVLKNELSLLRHFLTQGMLKARQCADIKMELSRKAAINIKGKRI